jgi:isocitrate/isopropylmalate dehydrogenase
MTSVDSIRRNGVSLKGPLTTPSASGFRSINVAIRKEFELYANVRPALSLIKSRGRATRTSTSFSSARTPRDSTSEWSTTSGLQGIPGPPPNRS